MMPHKNYNSLHNNNVSDRNKLYDPMEKYKNHIRSYEEYKDFLQNYYMPHIIDTTNYINKYTKNITRHNIKNYELKNYKNDNVNSLNEIYTKKIMNDQDDHHIIHNNTTNNIPNTANFLNLYNLEQIKNLYLFQKKKPPVQ
ncbi:hypothetical protein PBILCG01_1131600 [Plasmodium sp. DRC-Itaito]|nr:hypothetical protein PBILCG01_1131600 [Plasmodium sp. DRC-Itaito]